MKTETIIKIVIFVAILYFVMVVKFKALKSGANPDGATLLQYIS